jgi:hypothetical protein
LCLSESLAVAQITGYGKMRALQEVVALIVLFQRIFCRQKSMFIMTLLTSTTALPRSELSQVIIPMTIATVLKL